MRIIFANFALTGNAPTQARAQIKITMKKLYFLLAAFTMTCHLIHAQKIVKSYYDYKKTKVHEEYATNNYGVKTGSYKEFSEFGGILVQGTYKNDIRVGKWVTNNSDGTPSMIENFNDNGERNGIFKSWLNGHVITEANYVNGKKNGNCKEWNASADQLKSDANYKDGQMDGKCLIYYENESYQKGDAIIHQIKSETNYKAGVREGKFISYNKKGGLNCEGTYANDIKIGEWKYYNEDGSTLRAKFIWDTDNKGKGEEYYPSGKLKMSSDAVSKNGDILYVGKQIGYFESGVKQYEQENDSRGNQVPGSYHEFLENGQPK